MTQIKFGTDGWRGLIADDFTFENVRRVAGAIAGYVLKLGCSAERFCGHRNETGSRIQSRFIQIRTSQKQCCKWRFGHPERKVRRARHCRFRT